MQELAAQMIQSHWKKRQEDKEDQRQIELQRAKLRAAFEAVDTDGGGTLDTEEVGQLLRDLGEDLDQDELEAHMLTIDADGSGELDFDEFCELLKSWQNGDLKTPRAGEAHRKAPPSMPALPAAMPALPVAMLALPVGMPSLPPPKPIAIGVPMAIVRPLTLSVDDLPELTPEEAEAMKQQAIANRAAVKFQAVWRGHSLRMRIMDDVMEDLAANMIQHYWRERQAGKVADEVADEAITDMRAKLRVAFDAVRLSTQPRLPSFACLFMP